MTPSDHTEKGRGIRARLGRSSVRTRSVLAATGLLVVGISATGVAATGSTLREGVRNGTSTRETEIISRINASSGPTGGYSTRQSNLSSSGGGAIYGCRATAGSDPCVRANNLSNGLAFEFNASRGTKAGTIAVGGGGDGTKPFTTNATGVATGLNADRVDGASAVDIANLARVKTGLDADLLDGRDSTEYLTRWALVNESGTIEQQTGGFSVVNCFKDNDNCYINTGADARNKGVHAQVSVANTDGSAVLTGQTGVAPCGLASVSCAPTGAKGNNNVVVVALRQGDGSSFGSAASTAPTAAQAARFYVFVDGTTGSATGTGTPPPTGTSGTGSTAGTAKTGSTAK